ncbi:transposon TX1 uncharacterized [Tanacetum coccineum]
MATNPNDVRLTVLMALQYAHDEEACLEEQILSLMHRFADRFTNPRPKINRLNSLPDHPLIEYGRYALGCMTGADMKKATYLKMVRDELLRSMEEKRQLIKNYKEMRFTRFDNGGLKASKLDRFLVSNSFLNIWDDCSVSVLCRSYSDHCPIMLKVDSRNFRPKPFRIFDKWIARDVLSRRLFDWDIKAEAGLINDEDVIKREEWMMDLDNLDQLQREDLKQKWVHVNGVWHDDLDEIKHAAANYFSSRFKEPLTSRPTFNSPLFRKLSESDACFFEAVITEKEIKEAVWGCAGSKAPRPEGFNFNFIKVY